MSETLNQEFVCLHSQDTFNFLESVAVQTVTPEEQKQRKYQRFFIARKQSLKKINNTKAAIRGKLQELEHQNELVKAYDQQLLQLAQTMSNSETTNLSSQALDEPHIP